jgi:putative SOS response-associated peptidase YedK
MPVILSAEHYDRWLDPGMRGLEGVLGLLKPYNPALMRRYSVSKRVNLVTNDGPECSVPVDLPPQTGSLFG